MNLLSNLRQELEATELKPISVEISEQQLVKIAIMLVVSAALIFAIKALIRNIS